MFSFTTFLVFMLVQSQNSLDDYRWKNRILIISSDEKQMLNTQLENFSSEQAGFVDRKLVVFNLDNDPGKSPSRKLTGKNSITIIRKTYHIPQRGFQMVLIGLDGGVKKTWQKPVNVTEIYRLIDAMPMRKNNP